MNEQNLGHVKMAEKVRHVLNQTLVIPLKVALFSIY